jgi:hypothetical protein
MREGKGRPQDRTGSARRYSHRGAKVPPASGHSNLAPPALFVPQYRLIGPYNFAAERMRRKVHGMTQNVPCSSTSRACAGTAAGHRAHSFAESHLRNV